MLSGGKRGVLAGHFGLGKGVIFPVYIIFFLIIVHFAPGVPRGFRTLYAPAVQHSRYFSLEELLPLSLNILKFFRNNLVVKFIVLPLRPI